MEENYYDIGDIRIVFGKTTVQTLLNSGYTIDDFFQIVEEPTLAQCGLFRDGERVATLMFYDLKEKIPLKKLRRVAIDLVLPDFTQNPSKPRGRELSAGRAFFNKLFYTGVIHLVAAGVFYLVFYIPGLLEILQNSGGGGARSHLSFKGELGIVLLIIPSIIIAFIWFGDVIGVKGKVGRKIAMSVWLIFNVLFSLVYLVLIGNLFSPIF